MSFEDSLSGFNWTNSLRTISGGPAQKLWHINGGELEQIQFLPGHVSVWTTEQYQGYKQNLEEPVNDPFGCLLTRTSVELRYDLYASADNHA